MTIVTLTGYIDVPPNRLDQVVMHLPTHIELTRAEAGCLSFDVTADPEIAGRFHVAEEFIDAAAFNHHQTRTRASVWAKITDGIARTYDISGLET